MIRDGLQNLWEGQKIRHGGLSQKKKILTSYPCWAWTLQGWTGDSDCFCTTPHHACQEKRALCSLPSLFSSKPNCPWIVWLGNSTLVSTPGCKTQRGKCHTCKEAFYSCWLQSWTYLLSSENVWYGVHSDNSEMYWVLLSWGIMKRKRDKLWYSWYARLCPFVSSFILFMHTSGAK